MKLAKMESSTRPALKKLLGELESSADGKYEVAYTIGPH